MAARWWKAGRAGTKPEPSSPGGTSHALSTPAGQQGVYIKGWPAWKPVGWLGEQQPRKSWNTCPNVCVPVSKFNPAPLPGCPVGGYAGRSGIPDRFHGIHVGQGRGYAYMELPGIWNCFHTHRTPTQNYFVHNTSREHFESPSFMGQGVHA